MTKIVADNIEITNKNLSTWLNSFLNTYQKDLKKLGDYYYGKNAVIKKNVASGRPNYEINVNLAKYITDVQTGYFVGKPISYDYTDKGTKIKEVLEPIFTNNYEEDENLSLAQQASIYGAAYEIVMVTGENTGNIKERLKFSTLDPTSTFMVVSNTPLREEVCAVYLYQKLDEQTKKQAYFGYVYDDKNIYSFSWNGSNATISEETNHQFGAIPVIEFSNTKDEMGDYQAITKLLDALSLAISNNTDDLQSVANAILAIYGASGTDQETINKINQTKVAKLPVGSKMEYVVKNLDVDCLKNHVETLLKLIYQISQTPDLSNDDFGGNQSGVAMEFKLWGLEQSRGQKINNFQKALIKRIKLILNMVNLSTGSSFDLLQAVNIVFYKNLPKAESSIYDMVAKLQGIVSDKTLFSQIPFVKDVDAELKQKEEEDKAKVEQFTGYNSDFNENQGEEKNKDKE